MGKKTEDVSFIISFDDKGTAKLRKVVDGVEKELKGLGDQAKKTGKQTSGAGDDTQKTGKQMSAFKKILKSTWGQMAAGMGVTMAIQSAMRAVRQTVTDTIRVGREFEKEWANVTTMLSISEDATRDMQKELVNLSPTLGDTTMLAKGMYQVLSASVEPAKAISFLGEAAKSAQAGVTEVATSVDALTTVINGYGMKAEDVTKVSDIMFQTVKRGKLTYEGMAGAIGAVVPIASQVGVRFEEIAAAMATLTRQGVDVNTTTVQLRQILVSVLKPQQDAIKYAKDMGIAFNVQAVASMGLGKWLQHVMEKTGGSAEASSILFGNVRALSGVMGLAGTSAEEFAKDIRLMETSTGATNEAFVKQMKTVDFWATTIKNSINKIKIVFFQGITKSFREGINSADDFQKKFELKLQLILMKTEKFGEDLSKAFKPIRDFFLTLEALSKGKSVFQLKLEKDLENAGMEFKIAADYWASGLTNISIEADELYKKWRPLTEEGRKWIQHLEERNTALESLEDTHKRFNDAIMAGGDVAKKAAAEIQLELDSLISMKTQMENNIETSAGLGLETNLLNTGIQGQINKLIELRTKLLNTAKAEKGLAGEASELEDVFGKLGLKTKTQLNLEFDILLDNFNSLRSSGLSTGKQVEAVAKKLVELGTELGRNVNSEIQILAGNFKLVDTAIPPVREGLQGIIDLAVELVSGTALSKRGGELGKAIERIGEEIGASFIKNMYTIPSEFESRVFSPTKLSFTAWVNSNKRELERLGQSFDLLGDDIGGKFGNLVSLVGQGIQQTVSLVESGVTDFKDVLSGLTPILGQIGGAFGELIAGVAEGEKSFAKLGATIGSALGSLIPGLGPLGKAAGGLLGGLLGGLFKKKDKKTEEARLTEQFDMQVAEAIKSMSKFGVITESTAKAIAESRKTLAGWVAEAINFDKVLQDITITQSNINELWVQAHGSLGAYEAGLITADDASKSLNDQFSILLENSRRLGTEGSRSMLDFILAIRESGVEVASVTNYIEEELKKIPMALKTMIDDIRFGDVALLDGDRIEGIGRRLDRMSSLAVTSFNAMLREGKSFLAVTMEFSEPLEMLLDKYKELGRDVPAFLQPMTDLMEKMQLKPRIFQELDAATSILHSLANTAYLNQDAFDNLAMSAARFARTIIGVKGNLSDIMNTMKLTDTQIQQLLPTISQFVGVAATFGLNVPGWMKAFVTKQLGVDWGEFKRTAEAQANAGIATVDRLDKLLAAQTNQRNLIRARLEDVGNRVDRGSDGIIREIRNIDKMASGGYVPNRALKVLGEKEPEFVIPQSRAVGFAASILSGGGGSSSGGDSTELSAKLDEVIRAIKEGEVKVEVGNTFIPLNDMVGNYLMKNFYTLTKNGAVQVHPNALPSVET